MTARKLDMAGTMDAIAAALVTGSVVAKAYGWPAPIVQKRQAAVGYPERVEFDMAFGRGLEQAVFPVWIVCGLPGEETTRDEVSRLVGSTTDVKTALDGSLGDVVSSLRVIDARIETYDTTGGAFVAVRFDCEVLS